MSRALVTFERQGDGGWRPTVAWLGTPQRLDSKALPGDGRRDAWVQAVRQTASRPSLDDGTQGTWEDWVGWALNALANGHDTWAVEVRPELTVDGLYQREILGVEPQPLTAPNVQPEAVVPSDLGGYKRARPSPR